MLESALDARTGDDVLGEDPATQELERYAADLFEKESSLFFPSGTMANLASMLAHHQLFQQSGGGGGGGPGEALVGRLSHVSLWEAGGAASLGGIHTRQIAEDPGTARIPARRVRDNFRDASDDHCAPTFLVCLENTHNMLGGAALDSSYAAEIKEAAAELGGSGSPPPVAVHVDGARIFNASIATGEPPADLCRAADSVSVCLSKGLGAPLGSLAVGSSEFVRLARRARKRLGGGMRQSGVVAAMGLHALVRNAGRLADDHRRAGRLAEALRSNGFALPVRGGRVDTNIVYFALPGDDEDDDGASRDASDRRRRERRDAFASALRREHGVRVSGGYGGGGGRLFRAVTHLDVDDAGLDRAIGAILRVGASAVSRRG
jgi:threonine aldolase